MKATYKELGHPWLEMRISACSPCLKRRECVRRGNDCNPVGRSALFNSGDGLTVDKDALKHKDLLRCHCSLGIMTRSITTWLVRSLEGVQKKGGVTRILCKSGGIYPSVRDQRLLHICLQHEPWKLVQENKEFFVKTLWRIMSSPQLPWVP